MITAAVARIFLASDIAETIFPDNSFIRLSIDDSAFIYGKQVQLPQSGATPAVQKNRTVYPLPIAKRADTLTTYDIDEYSTDGAVIQWTEKMVAPYNKSQSVTRDHTGILETATSEGVLYKWAATSGNIIRTTGGARLASATSATGNRKIFTRQDIINLRLRMDRDNIPQKGRVLLCNADMFNDLLADTNLLNMFLMGQALQATAELQKVLGFEIHTRSQAVRYTTGLVARDYAEAGAATDCAGALAWHPNFVRAAIAGVQVFLNPDQAAYQGDLLSALGLVGAAKRYTDGRGIYAAVEDVAP